MSFLTPTQCIVAGAVAVLSSVLIAAATSNPVKPTTSPSAPYAPARRMDNWWVQRHEDLLKRNKSGPTDLLFLGDSITQGWNCRFMLLEPAKPDDGPGRAVWEERYAPKNAANISIGGDGIQHLLWRITEGGEIDGMNPKVIVLLIGCNNLLGGEPADKVAAGVGQVTALLRERMPSARIVLMGVFPTGQFAGAPVREKIQATNRLISKLDDGKHIRFLDIGDKLADDSGFVPAEIMPDGVHPSAKGYEIWARAMQPLLDELWNAKP